VSRKGWWAGLSRGRESQVRAPKDRSKEQGWCIRSEPVVKGGAREVGGWVSWDLVGLGRDYITCDVCEMKAPGGFGQMRNFKLAGSFVELWGVRKLSLSSQEVIRIIQGGQILYKIEHL
jgi:hypothetical protein